MGDEVSIPPQHKAVNRLSDPAEFLAMLMEVTGQIKHTGTPEALHIFAVNRSYEVVQYDQAIWFDIDAKRKPHLRAISNVPIIKKDVPFVHWATKAAKEALSFEKAGEITDFYRDQFSKDIQDQWKEFKWGNTLWVPMFSPKGDLISVLWLNRISPIFQPRDHTLVAKLAENYAYHQYFLLGDAVYKKKMLPLTKRTLGGLAIFTFLCMLIPIRESSLASMEIRPKNPLVIAAPIAAAVKDIYVPPNTRIRQGDKLLSFDDTEIKSDFEFAQESLRLTEEKLRTVSQGSFTDENVKAEIRLIKAQLAKDAVVNDYKKKLYDLVEMYAPVSGLLVYSDKNDWIGRPVNVGEKIMTIADENQVEVEAKLAVGDDFDVPENAEIKIFLNSDPLNSLSATLRTISFTAEKSSDDTVAYTVIADLNEGVAPPRIGSQGTAKIYGDSVPLGVFLFRKPISALRQMVGL